MLILIHHEHNIITANDTDRNIFWYIEPVLNSTQHDHYQIFAVKDGKTYSQGKVRGVSIQQMFTRRYTNIKMPTQYSNRAFDKRFFDFSHEYPDTLVLQHKGCEFFTVVDDDFTYLSHGSTGNFCRINTEHFNIINDNGTIVTQLEKDGSTVKGNPHELTEEEAFQLELVMDINIDELKKCI